MTSGSELRDDVARCRASGVCATYGTDPEESLFTDAFAV